MQKAGRLIRTKLNLPFTRPELVLRPRLQERVTQGLRGPLTLITAPAGFGKTTLVASCVANCEMPIAWLSLDKNDNQVERFLTYLIATFQEIDNTIGSEAIQQLTLSQQVPLETVMTNLVNDLDAINKDIALVLDDYQYINNQAVHEQLTFLLEHCPNTLHLLIATRSDPPLPLVRLRGRGQIVELRTSDLRFTEPEAAEFLNDIMGLHLDAGEVTALTARAEGWITGLQMAALSMHGREDIAGFIESFSGTNRFILDYLLEEVLANQPPEIQRFLLYTSILDRMTAPLCEAILANYVVAKKEGNDRSIDPELFSHHQSISNLEYLERANLFLVPLDDEGVWYRYHHLFADLLRNQLQKSLEDQEVAQLHLRAAVWHEQNGSILEAIQHASMASADEMVEHLIEQNYLEMMNRGEMSWVRFWMGKLSKDLIYRRPWLCLYEALNHSWFGQLEEANSLLNVAEKSIRAKISDEIPSPDIQSMLGYHAYVKSRVTAMQGDTQQAIKYCHIAREYVPADNIALQIDFSITLGYEYFLYGDFVNATKILNETIQLGYIVQAINNPVAAYCILARMQIYQGNLHEANDLLNKAAQLILVPGGKNLGVFGLVEVELAALLCEWNDVDVALAHLKGFMDYLTFWGKVDDLCLAYTIMSRLKLAQGDQFEAEKAIEKAAQLIRTCGVFSEARNVVEAAQVKLWLKQKDWVKIDHWVAKHKKHFDSYDEFKFEDELIHITRARVLIAQNKLDKALCLLSGLEESAQSSKRMGIVIQILILKALAMLEIGDSPKAVQELAKSLILAVSEGYVRVFLDEGQSMRLLIAQWLAHASSSPLRDYATHLLTQFDAEPHLVTSAQDKIPMNGDPSASSGQYLVERLSQRELEVLHLIALGRTNQEIAHQLIVSPGTIKAHTASIYRKLDVANRTEAVARARQLSLLP